MSRAVQAAIAKRKFEWTYNVHSAEQNIDMYLFCVFFLNHTSDMYSKICIIVLFFAAWKAELDCADDLLRKSKLPPHVLWKRYKLTHDRFHDTIQLPLIVLLRERLALCSLWEVNLKWFEKPSSCGKQSLRH